VAFNFEKGEHSKQNGFAIVKFSEELPFTFANSHKEERNYFVSKVVVSASSPVPDVAPQHSVQ